VVTLLREQTLWGSFLSWSANVSVTFQRSSVYIVQRHEDTVVKLVKQLMQYSKFNH